MFIAVLFIQDKKWSILSAYQIMNKLNSLPFSLYTLKIKYEFEIFNNT